MLTGVAVGTTVGVGVAGIGLAVGVIGGSGDGLGVAGLGVEVGVGVDGFGVTAGVGVASRFVSLGRMFSEILCMSHAVSVTLKIASSAILAKNFIPNPYFYSNGWN